MDGNGVAGGMMPGMPLHQHQRHHRQTPPPPALQQHQHPEQLMLFTSQPSRSDADVHNAAIASKHVYPFGGGGGGNMRPAPSSEDEPSSAFGDEYGGGELGMTQQPPQRGVAATSVSAATPSPWQRMKWTDTMVKLLIMVVYCVGDDGGGPEGGGGGHPHTKAAKKGSSSSTAAPPCAGLQQQQQQKKGKWKSVSRAMMEKGYYVSPQQCEDKFNDLNKRYKRVNDILGRGTACRVVENQALLDAMDHLSPKAKEEVRKLLNSKHLFFREMCAYHRSCAAAAANANAAGAGGGVDPAALQAHHLQYSCEVLTPPSDVSITQLQQQQQQRCHHPSDVGSSGAFPASGAPAVPGVGREGDGGDDDGMAPDEDDDEEDDDEDDDDYGEDDDDLNELHHPHHRRHDHEEQDDEDSKELFARSSKRQRRSSSSSPLFPSSLSPSVQSSQQQLRVELAALTGTPEQQRQWLKWRAVELEERRVSYGRRALELEKQRFKWLRFSGNKEREMERAKLENQRLSLDTDRMLLLLRQREFDLVSSHHGGGQDLRHSATSPNGAPPTTSAA